MKSRNMTSIYLYDDNNRMLMLYRIGSRAIKDSYIGTAGGHMEPDEINDPKACVLRELKEEVGLSEDDIENVELRYICLRNKLGELRQNYYFFAKLKNSEADIKSNEGNLKWFNYDEIKTLDMPHTAKYMIRHYIDVGQFDNKLYVGVGNPGKVDFTEMEPFE
ncbi:MAG: NUDIX domain-containing protein [Clostridia bacterium]|nr:NUDIX domain-containing protein [Clostridia bacterium]